MTIETAERVSKLLQERNQYIWDEEIDKCNFCSINLHKVEKDSPIAEFYLNSGQNNELVKEIIAIFRDITQTKLEEIDREIEQLNC